MATPKLTAWSFSRYQDYITCPAKTKFKHIDRIKEAPNAAMERGSAIHKMAENVVASTKAKIPKELKLFATEFKALQKCKPQVEQQLAFNSKWKPAEWFGKDAWCRIVVDAIYASDETERVTLIDHKTGKPKDWHPDQLSLYAIAGFALYPAAKEVSAELWYLDSGPGAAQPVVYEAKEVPGLKRQWAARVKPMLNDTEFKPTPSFQCSWCNFSKKKGGPCTAG